MGVCLPECVKTCVEDQDLHIQGNKIFKKINTKLDIENYKLTPQEKNSLKECMKLLEEAEKVRLEIAKKFEIFLYNTGACVLTRPTLERGLITFFVNILIQIIICANERKVKFNINDISIEKFFFITDCLPYIEINKNILNILKKKYGFDFYQNEILMNGINSIIDFLSTIPSIKSVLENQVIVLKNLSLNSITNLEMLEQIEDSIDCIIFLIDFFSEIKNGILEAQYEFIRPNKIELFHKIAIHAAKRKLKDPKEIAISYALGDNCGKIDNWKQNITYREFHPLKY
jgi:hypothetical protein